MMNGRVFVITGATGATGKIAGTEFAGKGASLVLVGTDQGKLDALVPDLNLPAARLLTLTADLRNGPAVQKAAEAVSTKFGRVDALIHLVGGFIGGKMLNESTAEDFESMLNQHAWTTFNLLQAFGPRLAANKWGRILVVSALNVAHPTGKSGPYVAAKAAQEALILTAAAEWKDSGVTANIIQVKSIDVKGDGKGSTPADIVAAMQNLCSDESGKVNGERIPLG
jgi:NAD(P)-dependent dehydrogenase (short-subunit alcohol dehydrogenase family)